MSLNPEVGEGARRWLRQLSPAVSEELAQGGVPSPASRPMRVASALERFGAAPVDWAIALGRSMTELIVNEMPEFGIDPEEFETLRRGTESSVLDAMRWLDGGNEGPSSIPEEALSGNISFARRLIPLDRMLRGVRLGHARMSKGFLDACNLLVPEHERARQMRWVSEVLFAFIDDFADQMAVAYAEESHRWSVSAAAARAEVIRRILADETSAERELSQELGYDLSRDHVGLSLWFDPARKGTATPDLELAAREVLDQLGASRVLVHPVGGSRLWAWGSRTQFPRKLPAVDVSPYAADIRVAAGAPGQGMEGFRRTHQQAVSAERTAKATTGGAPGVTAYSDIAVVALLSQDMSAARELVCRELGPLARNADAEAALRETLLCYLEEESSPHAAAQRLYVARNTVAYRERRAVELLGYDVSERRFELQVALSLVRQFGALVLNPTQE